MIMREKKAKLDFVICPCCGTKLDRSSLSLMRTREKRHMPSFSYYYCGECGGSFAYPSETEKVFYKLKLWFLILWAAAILVVTAVDIDAVAVVMAAAVLVMMLIVGGCLGNKNRTADNGFVMVVEGAANGAVVDFSDENKLSERKFFHDGSLVTSCSYVFPRYNSKQRLVPNSSAMESLRIGHMYRLCYDEQYEYVQLADYDVINEPMIILKLKFFSQVRAVGELYTLEGDIIGKTEEFYD